VTVTEVNKKSVNLSRLAIVTVKSDGHRITMKRP